MLRTHPNPLVLKGARQFRFPGNLSISSKVIQRRLDYWRQTRVRGQQYRGFQTGAIRGRPKILSSFHRRLPPIIARR